MTFSEPKNMLIVCKRLPWHKDPDFNQYTYGDSGGRGWRLKKQLTPGSYVFFQTTRAGERYIIGYFEVDKIVTGAKAKESGVTSDSITDDFVLIGKKAKSSANFLLKFDRRLAKRFTSLSFGFTKSKTDLQVINSATRANPYIPKNDARMLLDEIKKHAEKESSIKPTLIPFEEIRHMKELKIRDYIAKYPQFLEQGALHYDKEVHVKSEKDKGRIDLILKDRDGKLLILEFKRPEIGSTDTINQALDYADKVRELKLNSEYRIGAVIGVSEVTPALERYAKKKGVELFSYGLEVHCGRNCGR